MKYLEIQVDDIYQMELFLRTKRGFELLQRLPDKSVPGFASVDMKKDGVLLKVSSTPQDSSKNTAEKSPESVLLESMKNFTGQDDSASQVDFSPQPSPELKAIIFDLDGTLIDSEPNYYESDRIMLAEYGINFTEEMKKRYVGTGNSFMMEDLRKRFNLPDSMEDLLEKKNRLYMELARKQTEMFPEMEKLLEKLTAMNLPMAIASGSSLAVIDELTRKVGVRDCFSKIVSSEEVPKGKPAPDIFIEAAKRLGIAPECAVVFEDTQYGVESAIRAGMRCVAIPTISDPLDDNFHMADLLFASGMSQFKMEKVLDWLETL